jgi:hypothetical protein
MIRTNHLAGALVACLGLACAGHAHYDPFVVPQERIYGSIKTIALAPTTAPSELADVDPARGAFDSLLTAELRNAGFAVVPSQETATMWKRVTDSLGGLFSPATGQRDRVRFNTARARAMHELQARFHADGWLHPRIVFAAAKFDEGEANWDGATQSYQSFGKKFLAALFGGRTHGKTRALSMWVGLEDMQGKDLYINQGGLQLYQVPSGRDFARIQCT